MENANANSQKIYAMAFKKYRDKNDNDTNE